MKDHSKRTIESVRNASGKVETSDPMVCFFYLLMRDEITPGRLESLMAEVEAMQGTVFQFSNGWLAKYSENIVTRLKAE